MPAKSEHNALPVEYQERPTFERVCCTLPPDLADYVRQQARRYPGTRASSNQSAFMRDLVTAHRAKFTTKGKRA
jgi:hypothetical protein